MKKTALVVALAVLLTIVFATAAFAHHQPSLYVSWEAGVKGNTGANGNSPHEGYAKNTEKCNVCHAVHRAPVQGLRVSQQDFTGAPATELKGTRVGYYADPAGGQTEMLLQTSVSNSCSYCHIATNIGGVRVYNGNVENYAGGGWQVNGYSHAGCTNCHSVHGAYTFQGALKAKIVKYTGQPSGMTSANGVVANAFGAEHVFNTGYGNLTLAIQDEIFANAADLPVALLPGNMKLFPTLADTINGVNAGNGTAGIDTADAQVSALCTICHANYSSASEQTINLDNERALFTNGYWDFTNVPTANAGQFLYKNHPVGPAAMNITAFSAKGDTTSATQVSWATAGTCRSCHDAGETDAAVGVVEQSWPHFTPGNWMFTKSYGAGAADPGNQDFQADEVNFGLFTPIHDHWWYG